jgi:hypothetical protein
MQTILGERNSALENATVVIDVLRNETAEEVGWSAWADFLTIGAAAIVIRAEGDGGLSDGEKNWIGVGSVALAGIPRLVAALKTRDPKADIERRMYLERLTKAAIAVEKWNPVLLDKMYDQKGGGMAKIRAAFMIDHDHLLELSGSPP